VRWRGPVSADVEGCGVRGGGGGAGYREGARGGCVDWERGRGVVGEVVWIGEEWEGL